VPNLVRFPEGPITSEGRETISPSLSQEGQGFSTPKEDVLSLRWCKISPVSSLPLPGLCSDDDEGCATGEDLLGLFLRVKKVFKDLEGSDEIWTPPVVSPVWGIGHFPPRFMPPGLPSAVTNESNEETVPRTPVKMLL
jgi:hypothetical protein